MQLIRQKARSMFYLLKHLNKKLSFKAYFQIACIVMNQ